MEHATSDPARPAQAQGYVPPQPQDMKVLGTVSASNVTATVVASPGPVDAQKTKPTSTDKNATPEAPVAALTLGESVSMIPGFFTVAMADDGKYAGKCWKMNPFYNVGMNMPLCLLSCCCPCVTMCCIEPYHMSKMSGQTFETEFINCCIISCLGCYSCYRSVVRTNFRKKYGLQGTPLTDCAQYCCFYCCTIVQEGVELIAMPEMKYAIPFPSEGLAKMINDAVIPPPAPVEMKTAVAVKK